MPSDALTAIYRAHPATRKLFDWILAAAIESSRTTVEELVDHCGLSRRQAVNLLRALADAGYGEFKVGRKGHPSRFEWTEDRQTLVEQLDGLAMSDTNDNDNDNDNDIDNDIDIDGDEPVEPEPTNGELIFEMFPPKPSAVANEPPQSPRAGRELKMIEHVYVLRPTLRLRVELPEDLSAREAEVLGDWLRNLSFDR